MARTERKNDGRGAFLRARELLKKEEIQDKSQRVFERLLNLEEYRKADSIFFYASKGSEVDTTKLIEKSLQLEKKIALPRCKSDCLIEARWISDLYKDCAIARYGILEPQSDKTLEAFLSELDLFVIPGIAFDLVGNRMGYGKGYFDRYLSALKPSQIKLGLAYEIQINSLLKVKSNDVKMDILVTEERVIRIKS